ncbi:SIR2 family protein [Bradyrhizobium huanghuaihaiense]|uniref:SIR2 family protein n=1 Tax=Bradyrhizobium huanghuaihaiense TaxID=990078 RepID=UPI0021A9B36A|nr:SIR2 family protein [Bradyrhizobium sp. CB3035]UWU75570.1 SIR2 family protein [Bradyrhizobium sp. CB3035]
MAFEHDAHQCVSQLRQTLSADKLPIGFFLGAGCPCAVMVDGADGSGMSSIIPDIRGLTAYIHEVLTATDDAKETYSKLLGLFKEDEIESPNVELMLNRVRQFRQVAGKVGVRGLSADELASLDRHICKSIGARVKRSLPPDWTPYHSLAEYVGRHRSPSTELFTTNYDMLLEEALEHQQVPYFDGFVGSSRPFFDQKAIEDGGIPQRWARLWKLHGSINWRFNKASKVVVRTDREEIGDELLIHPSHLKYDESRRMPYLVMADRLKTFLKRGERPVALFILGYSFGDEHINEALIDCLRSNPSAACFAIQYDALSRYPDAVKLATENSNLSVMAKDRAVIRRRESGWLVRPTRDVASLAEVFTVGAEFAGTDSDAPRPCEFEIGDFARFGDFLRIVSSAVGEAR